MRQNDAYLSLMVGVWLGSWYVRTEKRREKKERRSKKIEWMEGWFKFKECRRECGRDG